MYALHCLDRPDAAHLREAHREAHAAYMRRHAGQVVLGGPLLSTDGKTRIGILVVIDLPDIASVEHFMRNEPYQQAGLFTAVSLTPFQAVMQANQTQTQTQTSGDRHAG